MSTDANVVAQELAWQMKTMFTRPYGAPAPSVLEIVRDAYVRGDIELEEFEHRIGGLLADANQERRT